VPPDASVEIDTTVLRHPGEPPQQRATLDGELEPPDNPGRNIRV
jgi:hypothetical protein